MVSQLPKMLDELSCSIAPLSLMGVNGQNVQFFKLYILRTRIPQDHSVFTFLSTDLLTVSTEP